MYTKICCSINLCDESDEVSSYIFFWGAARVGKEHEIAWKRPTSVRAVAVGFLLGQCPGSTTFAEVPEGLVRLGKFGGFFQPPKLPKFTGNSWRSQFSITSTDYVVSTKP